MSDTTLLVTGGAGFIGSNYVLQAIAAGCRVVNLDLLTYAGNLQNLRSVVDNPQHHFVHGDIADGALIGRLLDQYRPSAIVHFAAESHVDRSILKPSAFVATNIAGTQALLDVVLSHWQSLDAESASSFRFVHVSTDEVYGSLNPEEPAFTEETPYRPNSPYAASKAGSDHLVRAYFHTYGLPTLTTNCSNNYGPFQFPEKLIPLMIHNALQGCPLPVYGDGQNVRDWLFVSDHCSAIQQVCLKGRPGETYNIGGSSERKNLDVVKRICSTLDELRPAETSYADLIQYVKDRPGHDRRYAVDCSKLSRELGWSPSESFETGMRKTIRWYLDHADWVADVTSGEYRKWVATNYDDRSAA